MAKIDKKIVFMGSDLGPGVLSNFKKEINKRFFMEGVSEQSIIGTAAGLAMDGYKPYVNTIATFITRRCFEQIVVDLCLHNLPVKLIANGGGLVYAPLGPTHQSIEDISILRTLPNLKIIAPCDAVEMEKLIQQVNKIKNPVYVRIAKGGDEIITKDNEKIFFGIGNVKLKPEKTVFLTTGVMTQIAIKACKILNQKQKKKSGVIHFGTITPLDKKILLKWIPKVNKIITVEENVLDGGFGSSILEFTSDNFPQHLRKIKRVGLEKKFIDKYGNQEDLLKYSNLTIQNLVKKAMEK